MLDLKARNITVKDIRDRQAVMEKVMKDLNKSIFDHGSYEISTDLMEELKELIADAHDLYNKVIDNTEVFR